MWFRNKINISYFFILSCLTLVLVGCGGSGSSDPIIIDEPPPSLITLSDNQVAIYYHRDDGDYTDWGLHLWNGESCGNYASPTTDSEFFNRWATPYPADGVDPVFGAYYVLSYEPNSGDCLNFILHKGDERALGSNNSRFDLSTPSQHAFSFHGNANIFYTPITEVPVTIEGAAAHWLDQETLVWAHTVNAKQLQLVASSQALLSFNPESKVLSGGESITLTPSTLSSELAQKFPDLAQFPAFNVDLSNEQIKSWLKGQLYAVAMNDNQVITAVTLVQTPGVLDTLYTIEENDANERSLGSWHSEQGIQFSLWAPTAQQVLLEATANIDSSDKHMVALVEDPSTGIFSTTATIDWDRFFYRYQITAYHPTSDQLEVMTVTDPYSLSLSSNSQWSQVVNLGDEDLLPIAWAEQSITTVTAPEDHIIYEAHIRDFSAFETRLNQEGWRGKYLAFTDSHSHGVEYLQSLAQAGINTFHILPSFDIATINENPAERVDIQDSISQFCLLVTDHALCATDIDQTQSIVEYLSSLDPNTDQAQTLVEAIRPLDSYNWGYDPLHYSVPEGSYATNAHGVTRIIEFRQMVQNLHKLGFRVVMDVVYNHTNASGLSDKSVLDKVVPGYYHRRHRQTGQVETSTCCDNTATEHTMMAKLMVDSLLTWTTHYKVDGFRFDLMGHQPKTLMLAAREAVQTIDPDNYFYGEGWNFGEVANDHRFVQATQLNLAGSSIGTFTDRLRDAVRGGGPFDSGNDLRSNQGLANGLGTLLNEQNMEVTPEFSLSLDQARIGLTGNLADFLLLDGNSHTVLGRDVDYNGAPSGYALDPADTINYVSKHDNQTLWDNNQYKITHSISQSDRVRMQLLALSHPLMAQGIPFIHMGSELLRSKSFLRDSFDFGDWFNRVDFTQQSNNFNVGLPPEEKDGDNWPVISDVLAQSTTEHTPTPNQIQTAALVFQDFVKIRANSPLLKLRTATQIQQRIDFRNVGSDQQPGLIVMTIDDGLSQTEDLDPSIDAMVIMMNHTGDEQFFTLPGTVGAVLHAIQQQGQDTLVKTSTVIENTLTIPKLTTAIFVLPQGNTVGIGLPVNQANKDRASIPPFANTTLYLRGTMNSWDLSHPMTFIHDGRYEVTLDLVAGEYEFKLADENWSIVNLGFDNVQLDANSLILDSAEDGGNFRLNIETSLTLLFSITFDQDALPILSVTVL